MLLLALVLLAIVGTVAAVALAIVRTEVDLGAMRFALVPVGIGTVAMGVGTIATILLTALGFQAAPQIAPGDLVVPVIMMVGGVLLAVTGLRRGLLVMRQPAPSA